MIKHIVLLNLKESIGSEVIESMQHFVGKIKEEVPEVRDYHLVPNMVGGECDFNWAIISEFEDQNAIEIYKQAPIHQRFVEYCDPYTDDYLTLDYLCG